MVMLHFHHQKFCQVTLRGISLFPKNYIFILINCLTGFEVQAQNNNSFEQLQPGTTLLTQHAWTFALGQDVSRKQEDNDAAQLLVWFKNY